MQRQVMKHAQDARVAKMLDESLALFEARQQEIKHMKRLLAVLGHYRHAYPVRVGPFAKLPRITLPDPPTLPLGRLGGLQLADQEAGQQVGRKMPGAVEREG